MSRLLPRARRILEASSALSSETDEALKGRLHLLRERAASGEPLEGLLDESYAITIEAASRTLGMRHYPNQVMAGIALFQGVIIEMPTGEGKTLSAVLPSALAALARRGVHVVTVNDYLATRDADWMRPCYEFLGLSVGSVHSGQSGEEKRAAYACDVTYAVNNELGFDYLRDHLVMQPEDLVQRGRYFAIVDEADSALIDEARTPLAITGSVPQDASLYQLMDKLSLSLTQAPYVEREYIFSALDRPKDETEDEGDYMVNPETHLPDLTDRGLLRVEALLRQYGLLKEEEDLYQPDKGFLLHHINLALRARHVFKKDVNYVISDGEVVLIDEHTGRLVPGRRLGEGLHQALEAKEGLSIREESQTLASISFQNYFRSYEKLSGMSGTAREETFEFMGVYGLDVWVIPPHKPLIRKDYDDLIFVSEQAKVKALIAETEAMQKTLRPVLIGTTSVQSSQALSEKLVEAGIPHAVLNAKNHFEEADIIAESGRPGAVTVVTNMAGRGVDIVLGGNLSLLEKEAEAEKGEILSPSEREAVVKAWQEAHDLAVSLGGLCILASERHESRRVDNQLRGRAGRQGDPGSSRFYLSLDDALIQAFVGEKTRALIRRSAESEDAPLEHRLVTKSVARAQRRIEGQNYEARRSLIEMDNVLHEQRSVIYADRDRFLLSAHPFEDEVIHIGDAHLDYLLDKQFAGVKYFEQLDEEALSRMLFQVFSIENFSVKAWVEGKGGHFDLEALRRDLHGELSSLFAFLKEKFDPSLLDQIARQMLLSILDQHWRTHLGKASRLRQSLGWQSYAQKDPAQMYKRESFKLFSEMVDSFWNVFFSNFSRLSHAQIQPSAPESAPEIPQESHHEDAREGAPSAASPHSHELQRLERQLSAAALPRVGRNDPCPCGSGKKYKHCHGKTL